MTKGNKDSVINLRVSEQLKKEIKKLADNDRRNLSDFINVQLEILVEKSKKK